MTPEGFKIAVLKLHEDFKASTFDSASDFLENIRENVALRPIITSCPIVDSGENLIELPAHLRLPTPHPYKSVGAPYGEYSPWFLRESVLAKVLRVQQLLANELPGFRLGVFDAYRPVEVQAFMIDLERDRFAKEYGKAKYKELSAEQQAVVKEKVYSIWAPARTDPAMPSPHSTGGVLDLTILDDKGNHLPMGSKIDEYPPTSLPAHYRSSKAPQAVEFHKNRQLLTRIMGQEDFRRLPHEWWHFSYGDQQWAIQKIIATGDLERKAMYSNLL